MQINSKTNNTKGLNTLLARSEQIISGGFALDSHREKFKTYAISNFRGGIGKSTLSFNLSYELSRQNKLLIADTCSQKNLSQNIFGEQLADQPTTIYDALVAELTNTQMPEMEDLVVKANAYCASFSGGKSVFMIPGSSHLFLFPSLLYGQLAQYGQLGGTPKKTASQKVLNAFRTILDSAAKFSKPDKILIDTSPFFGGATHLAWCAAEALIIPVRVDQNSVEALRLTLQMLKDRQMDLHRFNEQAGLSHAPIVHAVAMTHCGWSRTKANSPDSSTKFFAQSAIDIATEFKELFSDHNVANCFYLLDDFHSAGRISGNQRIPLSKLNAGDKYLVDGQRLQVNPSVDRYKRQITSLSAAL